MNKRSPLHDWFKVRGWEPLPFQLQTWQAILEGKSGLIQAASGTGKTYALIGGFCQRFIEQEADDPSLKLLWITPLRALATDLTKQIAEMVQSFNPHWTVGFKTSDTTAKEKNKQAKQLPTILITTPESLHVLLSKKGYQDQLKSLKAVVIDEWHELLGSKRGVQVELALSRLFGFFPQLQAWALSATLGEPQEALKTLCGHFVPPSQQILISSFFKKFLDIHILIPPRVDPFLSTGHLVFQSLPQLIPFLEHSRSTLLFTNTRSQAEQWFQKLIEIKPEWIEQMGIHHGSLDSLIRRGVESALKQAELKVVVCTSSLDLGIDFHPVDLVVQIGSPKSIARTLQRAGRSGHTPQLNSQLVLVPNQALELIEMYALKKAIQAEVCEVRKGLFLCFDVLIQYLLTLAAGEGFDPSMIYQEVTRTSAFRNLSLEQWEWILHFLSRGGAALQAYPDYQKIELEKGLYKMNSIQQIRRHRLSIGTLMDHPSLPVSYLKGEILGTVDEDFATRLKPGDLFWYNGKCLKFVYLRDMTVWVRRSTSKKQAAIPRWHGERLPYSPLLSFHLMQELERLKKGTNQEAIEKALQPLLNIQEAISLIPNSSQFLIEELHSKEGYHFFFYPFEGRVVHEALSQLIAFRISQKEPISLSITSNDYGFEIVSDRPFSLESSLFSSQDLEQDLLECLKKTELVRYHFKEIARISGLLFTGYPGKPAVHRHLQMSAEILFKVFEKYDPGNLLIQQCYREVLHQKWDLTRLKCSLDKLHTREWIVKRVLNPTPFGFPLFIEQWRDQLSSEQLKERVEKMSLKLQKEARRAKED